MSFQFYFKTTAPNTNARAHVPVVCECMVVRIKLTCVRVLTACAARAIVRGRTRVYRCVCISVRTPVRVCCGRTYYVHSVPCCTQLPPSRPPYPLYSRQTQPTHPTDIMSSHSSNASTVSCCAQLPSIISCHSSPSDRSSWAAPCLSGGTTRSHHSLAGQETVPG